MGVEPENFNLHIAKTDKQKTFRALLKDDSGAPIAENEFQYTIDTHILARLEERLGKDIKATAGMIRIFGQGLFDTVFNGEILGHYKSRIKNGNTRLRLYFRQDQPDLLRVPWEFLHDGSDYLAAHPGITLSRVIEEIPLADKMPIPGKIRILVVVSSPINLEERERLRIEDEQMYIMQALDRAHADSKVEIDFEDEASLKIISERLDEEEYHIVHYSGHGAYKDRGYLLLEDERGEKTNVDNETIADLLAGHKSLRLVIFSGCQTAKTSGREAFSDLATPLLAKGIPAVVAMQYSVTDSSAIDLTTKLYSEIGNGTPVDMALTRARRSLYLDKSLGVTEFGTPVLFTKEPDCLEVAEVAESKADLDDFVFEKNVEIPLERLGMQFIGRRRELRRIKDAFFRRGVRMVVLHGIGGIGKTVTATKTSEKLKNRFDGVYAFDCREKLSGDLILYHLNEFFKRIDINVIEQIIKAEAPMDVKMNYLAQVLSKFKLLLIFDNFESFLPEEKDRQEISDLDLKKALKTLVTQCKDGSRFIFTSRYTFNLTDGRMMQIIDEINLGELSSPEAVMVMNRFYDIAQEGFGTKLEIFNKIGGHPYTINLFGQHANQTSVNDVMTDLSGVTDEMVEFTLLDRGYERLSESAKALVNSIAVLFKAIPKSGLEWFAGENGFSERLEKDISELVHWGMLVKVIEKDTLYQVHTIVKDYIKKITDDDIWKKRQVKAAEYYETIAEAAEYIDVEVMNRLDARDLYFAAREYDKAGRIAVDNGPLLRRWGLNDSATELYEKTIETTSENIKAGALHNLGVIYYARGDYESALEKYQASLKIKENLGDKSGIAISLHQIGNIHYSQGDYESALEKYQASLKIKEKLGDKSGIAYTLGQMGNINLLQGDYKKALENYNKCMEISELIGDMSSISIALHQIGMIYHDQGDYESALEKYQASLNIKEKLGDKSGIAYTLHQIGMIYHDQGDYESALEKYQASLKIKEKLGDKSGIADTLHQIGNIHYSQGDYESALEKYQASLKIKEKLGDKSGIATTLGQIGNIYYRQGEYAKAIDKYNEILKMFEELGDKSGIAISLHQIGMIYQRKGDYESALEKYQASLKTAEELGDKSGIAISIGQIGKVYFEKRQYKAALKNYLIAALIFEQLQSPNLEIVQGFIGELKEKTGKRKFEKLYKEVTEELEKEGVEY